MAESPREWKETTEELWDLAPVGKRPERETKHSYDACSKLQRIPEFNFEWKQ